MDEQNMMSPSSDNLPEQMPTEKHANWLLVTGLVIAGLILGGLIGYAVARYVVNSTQPLVDEQPVVEEEIDQEVTSNVAWQELQPIAILDVFSDDEMYAYYTGNDELSQFYKAGQIVEGQFSGYEVIVAHITPDGPYFGTPVYHFLKKDNEIILLSQYSNYWEGTTMFNDSVIVNDQLLLPDLNYPETIASPDGATILHKEINRGQFFDDSVLKLAFSHDQYGPVYVTNVDKVSLLSEDDYRAAGFFVQHGFYIKRPDGLTETYNLKPDFVNDNGIPQVVWSNGDRNTIAYHMVKVTGCGDGNYADVMTARQPETNISLFDLQVIGATTTNENVYGLLDSQHPLLQKIYNEEYLPYHNGDALSYEAFVASQPVFFWFDRFSRLIKFQRSDFLPQAECGKPVIYLYPEQEMNVNVQVSPQGGFSYTDPVYPVGGWNVIAQPTGQLREISSGQNYPYLFWEGRGGLYQSPDRGWVVPQVDVDNFLSQKLSALGLVENEIADFKEFWLPKMTEAPYYFISFYGNTVMDQLAPLQVSPAPDTVIRVLMDYMPLQQPIEVENYNIATPTRNGFTVVEWGGVLR